MTEPQRTWDGLEIAAERPRGSTVVVRRHRAEGPEFLLLHRNGRGPAYAGDWAWTSPAGARQPGEPVYRAALRELYEEAGLTGFTPWALDLSDRWAVFGLDVPAEVGIDLIDPEHDRYAWVDAAAAAARILPAEVAERTVARMWRTPPQRWDFAPMTTEHLADLVRWRSQPHVIEWFGRPLADVAHAERVFGARLRGESPTRMWVSLFDGRPVGFLQDYPIAAYDDVAVKVQDREAIGFDYLIGEPGVVGPGTGTAMIWSFMRDVLCRDYPDAPRFCASPDHRNARSLRALAKCGLEQGLWIDMPAGADSQAATEIVCTLDRAHWFGAA